MRQVHRCRVLAVLALLFGLLAIVGLAPAGAAQDTDDCDTYPAGCGTTSTTQPAGDPTCGIAQTTVQAGATVEVTLSNIEVGATFRVLVAGSEVARSTVQGTQGFLPMQAERTSTSVSFVVPDLGPGTYPVVVVGADFTISCGGGGLKVAGSSTGRDGLAFTGATILGLIALALILLIIGYVLVRRTRRHRHA